ncbi:MAG: CDGSH iron-sulfur domain-containing protein [Pseudomonadota bacterium]
MQKSWRKPRHDVTRLASAVQIFSPVVGAAASLPRVDCMEPALVALEADRRYAWCSCGLSKKQPFCDGSHAGTDWLPLLFTPKRSQLDWICTCKFTRQPPYCDAAHNHLPEHYQRYLKEHAVTTLPASGWLSGAADSSSGPRIALIHGLLAGKHMERNLLRWVREAGFTDANLFSNDCSPVVIADFLAEAVPHGRRLVLIGYSQGGFQVLKVAKALAKRGHAVDLVASLAAGGVGRLHPAQWFFRVRRLPANIKRLLNIYSQADVMGTDPLPSGNALQAQHGIALENIALAKADAIDHLALVRCFPRERVHPVVAERVLAPLLAALKALV